MLICWHFYLISRCIGIARIIDPEKKNENSYDWNAESLLMQVGYSVSKKEICL